MFKRVYNIDVTGQDSKSAQAIHFAAISHLIKNVQALVKLGADPNCQDEEGNTSIHLCLETLFDEESNFEKVKNIVKELIFSGAQRNITNGLGQTPIDLLEQLKPDLHEDDYLKLLYILTPP